MASYYQREKEKRSTTGGSSYYQREKARRTGTEEERKEEVREKYNLIPYVPSVVVPEEDIKESTAGSISTPTKNSKFDLSRFRSMIGMDTETTSESSVDADKTNRIFDDIRRSGVDYSGNLLGSLEKRKEKKETEKLETLGRTADLAFLGREKQEFPKIDISNISGGTGLRPIGQTEEASLGRKAVLTAMGAAYGLATSIITAEDIRNKAPLENKLTGEEGYWTTLRKNVNEMAQEAQFEREYGTSGFEKFMMDSTQAALEMIPSLIYGWALGGAVGAVKGGNLLMTAATKFGKTMIRMPLFAMHAAGNYANQALEQGQSYGEAAVFGLMGMVIETSLETIPFNIHVGLLSGSVLKELAGKGTRKIAAGYGMKLLEGLGTNFFQEALNEPAIKYAEAIAYGEKLPTAYEAFNQKEMLVAGLSGAVVALILGGGGFINTASEIRRVSKMNKYEATQELIKTLTDKANQEKVQGVIAEQTGELKPSKEQVPTVREIGYKPETTVEQKTDAGIVTEEPFIEAVEKLMPEQATEQVSVQDVQVVQAKDTVKTQQKTPVVKKTVTKEKVVDKKVEKASVGDYIESEEASGKVIKEVSKGEVFLDEIGVTAYEVEKKDGTKALVFSDAITSLNKTETISTEQVTEQETTKLQDNDYDIISKMSDDYKVYNKYIPELERNIKELTKYEQQLKDNKFKFGGLVQPSQGKAFSDFVDVKLKKYRQLLEKMQSKKMTKADIAEVQKLIAKKESIPALKAEFREKLKTQKQELREAFNLVKRDIRETNAIKLQQEIDAVKYKDEVDKINRKYWDKIEALEKKLDDEKYKAFWTKEITKQDTKKKLAELKIKVENKMKAAQKEKEARAKEEKRISDKTTKLLDSARKLNTTKKQMFPHYKALAEEFLSNFDITAKSITTKKLLSLTKSMEFFKEEQKRDPSYVIPPGMVSQLERLHKTQISTLTETDIDILQTTVDHITNQNALKGSLIAGQKLRQFEAVKTTMLDTLNKAQKIIDEDTKLKRNERKLLKWLITTGAVSPENMALKFSGWDYSNPAFDVLYTNLTEGQREMIDFWNTAYEIFEEAEKNLDISKKQEVVKLADTTIKLTGWEKISLYLHTTNEDNIKHLVNGGGRKTDYAFKYKFTENDIKSIENMLTVDEMKYAKVVMDYFNGMSKEALNEVSIKLLNYEIATIKNYFPIITDRLFRSKDFNKQFFKILIEQQSFLKERTSGQNTIMIEDIRNVMKRSVHGVGKYYGMAIPLRDAKMLLGDEQVKESIINKFGTLQEEYFEKLFQDIEGMTTELDPTDKWVVKRMRTLQQAYMGINPYILVKQTASFPTAFAELNPMDLASVQGIKPVLSYELMKKWSPLIKYRLKGHVTRETGEALLSKHMKWTSRPITFFDSLAIAKIWNVVEAEIKRTNPDVKFKSDEFYEKVARRTEEVIYRTQPNYTLMQRSDMLRRTGVVSRTITFFSTQRNQNYNIMYRSLMTMKKNPIKSAKAIVAVAIGSMIVALINSGRNKIRDDEDKLWLNFTETMLGNFFLVGDVFGMISKGYGVDNPAFDALNTLGRDILSARNADSRASSAGHFVKILGSLSQLSGIPLKNFIKSLEDIIRNTNPELYVIWQEFLSKSGALGTFNSRINAIKTEMEEGDYSNEEELNYLKTFVSTINKYKREYKEDVEVPHAEVGAEVPKGLIKAYDDIYKEIAKEALGR